MQEPLRFNILPSAIVEINGVDDIARAHMHLPSIWTVNNEHLLNTYSSTHASVQMIVSISYSLFKVNVMLCEAIPYKRCPNSFTSFSPV